MGPWCWWKALAGKGAATTYAADAHTRFNSDEEGEATPEWSEARSAMVFHMLPFFSGMAQSEWARSALNTAGVDQHFLKFCREVQENLDLVPEARPLRPRLEAYINGSDPDHFGDLVADLLQAWATSESPDAVRCAVSLHFRSLKAIVKEAKGKGKGKAKGKGLHGCMGPWFWWKVLAGKGAAATAYGPCCPVACQDAFASMLAEKGLGKGLGCGGCWQ
jgi:hypothetical protein